MSAADVRALREALDRLQQARARLESALAAGAPTQLLELHAAVLSTVRRLLIEMDLDERVWRQVRLAPRPRQPRPGAHPRRPRSGAHPRRVAGRQRKRSPHPMRSEG